MKIMWISKNNIRLSNEKGTIHFLRRVEAKRAQSLHPVVSKIAKNALKTINLAFNNNKPAKCLISLYHSPIPK